MIACTTTFFTLFFLSLSFLVIGFYSCRLLEYLRASDKDAMEYMRQISKDYQDGRYD